MDIVLYFSRRGRNDKWKVFLTTDTSLTFKKMVEHYQVRWTVEVYREAKQLLNLGKCQSSNFDAQVAETTISMIAYLLLTLRFRYDNYESKGALYRAMNADTLRETLDRRLCGDFSWKWSVRWLKFLTWMPLIYSPGCSTTPRGNP